MARRARILRDETLELYAHEESAPDRLQEIEQLIDSLTAEELRTVKALVEARRRAKLEEAKALLLREMEGRAKALGLTMKDVFPSHKLGTKRGAPVKYRARSQGSNLWQTQVMVLGISRPWSIFLWLWSHISGIQCPSA